MTPAGSSTVQVDAVSKRFRSRVALNEVSLRIGRGMTGLLGPNGAGKTTLLRILATTMSPDDGMVRIFDRDPAQEGDRLEIRRTLGYLPQEVGIYGDFTAFDFVDYVAILKEMTDTRRRRDDVRRVLTTVGLGDRMHAKIRTLSGGMRRRVGLAQALLGTPRLLILDEPTVGLDPVQRLRFRETVSAVASTETVVLSTHLTEDVAALCTQVIVLDHGRIRFAGSPMDLAAVADGYVWESDVADASAILSWLNGRGRYRNLGLPPGGADVVTPNVEDGYMLLTTSAASEVLS